MRLHAVWFLAGLVLILSSSCAQKDPQPRPDEIADRLVPGYEEELLRERREKDNVFRSGGSSPLPEEDRADFRGLDYYPVNPALRFRVRLNRYGTHRRVRLATNTGEIRSGLRYGYFDFEIGGMTYSLQAYRMDEDQGPGGPSLFIPFRDTTSGGETYPAGRYLEMPENTTGIYELDFNRAYNPYCAYRQDFSCPVPPEENVLEVAIRAGEKDYRRS